MPTAFCGVHLNRILENIHSEPVSAVNDVLHMGDEGRAGWGLQAYSTFEREGLACTIGDVAR